jgi:hypothetical protein
MSEFRREELDHECRTRVLLECEGKVSCDLASEYECTKNRCLLFQEEIVQGGMIIQAIDQISKLACLSMGA